MYEDVGLPRVVEEFVTKPLARMRAWHEARNVDEFYRYEPVAVDAYRVHRVVLHAKLAAGALHPCIRHADVWLNSGERVVSGGRGELCRGVEKRRFADVCLAYEPYDHRMTSAPH